MDVSSSLRLAVDGTFDLGATFGFGASTSAFSEPSRFAVCSERLRTLFGASVDVAVVSKSAENEWDDFSAVFGARAPLGFGLRVRLTEHTTFLQLWRENALQFWRENAEKLRVDFGDASYDEVLLCVEKAELPHAILIAFEVGCAFVRLHIKILTTQMCSTGKVARGVFKAFENAGYGEDLKPPTANAMLVKFRSILKEVYWEKESAIALLTDREVADELVDLPGFQGNVFIEKIPSPEWASTFFRPGDATHQFSFGNFNVRWSWLINLVEGKAGFEYGYARFLYSAMYFELFWQVTTVFESLFREKMFTCLNASLFGKSNLLSRRQLNHVRQLCALVITITNPESFSDYAGDGVFFAFYEQYAKIAKRHDRMNQVSLALEQIASDVQAEDEASESAYMNNLLLGLTIVSLVGISSGILGSWEPGMNLFQDHMLLWLVLLAPSIGVAAFVWLRNRLRK